MKQTIAIRYAGSDNRGHTDQIEADVKGGWGIHREYFDPASKYRLIPDNKRLWTLTHVPSGVRVMSYLRKADALAARTRAIEIPNTSRLNVTIKGKKQIPVDPDGVMPALYAAVKEHRV